MSELLLRIDKSYRVGCGTPACASVRFKAKNLVGQLLEYPCDPSGRRRSDHGLIAVGKCARPLSRAVLVRTRPRPRGLRRHCWLLAARPPRWEGSKERSGARPGGHSNANLQSARGGSNCLPISQRHGREMLGIIPAARGGSATHGYRFREILRLRRRPRGRGHGDGDDRWHQPDAGLLADRHRRWLRGRCGFGYGQFVRRPRSLGHDVHR